MLHVLTQSRVNIILNILRVKGDVVAHLFMVEVGEFLELLDSQHLLFLIVSVCKEADGLMVFVAHDVKDSTLLRILEIQLFFTLLVVTIVI
jgi:hypothetical protein